MYLSIIKNRVVTLIFFLFIFFVMFSDTPSVYAKQKNKEYYVKAAFILNFAKFTKWPSDVFFNSTTTLNLCILGKDPFDEALKTIEGKTVKERKLTITKSSSIDDINECHILFISTSEKDELSEIFLKIKDRPILTVAETGNFCQSGGIVNFIVVKNKVRFEINVDAAKRKGLKISSKLLKLSKIIKER